MRDSVCLPGAGRWGGRLPTGLFVCLFGPAPPSRPLPITGIRFGDPSKAMAVSPIDLCSFGLLEAEIPRAVVRILGKSGTGRRKVRSAGISGRPLCLLSVEDDSGFFVGVQLTWIVH